MAGAQGSDRNMNSLIQRGTAVDVNQIASRRVDAANPIRERETERETERERERETVKAHFSTAERFWVFVW